jgi:WD40 repeat protein
MFLLAAHVHAVPPGENPGQSAGSKALKPVSYFGDIQPILQRSCQGCHQPATRSGDLVLTTYDGFMAGAAKGKMIIAGQPDSSPVIAYLTGRSKPQMPFGGTPLPSEQIEIFRRWIAEGAKDDTPASAKQILAPGKLAVYHQAPVITALAYSPDGSFLAVSGYREIVLHKGDGSGLIARLPCISDKITSLAFSPDGSTLAAVGGTPATFGELQLWDVAARKLNHSITLTNDTLFGVSFSPDGKELAFGATDNAIYIFEAATGKQIRKITDHDAWVFGTVFSLDGTQIASVSRDRSLKLTDVVQGIFIENINALKGELVAIARQPNRDNVLVGGEDGLPVLYTMHRPHSLVIGDTSTVIREFTKQDGPVAAVAFGFDGELVAAAGGSPAINVYKAATGERIASLKGHEGGIYSVVFNPKAQQLAAAGFDGKVRIYDLKSGQIAQVFIPVPLEGQAVSLLNH